MASPHHKVGGDWRGLRPVGSGGYLPWFSFWPLGYYHEGGSGLDHQVTGSVAMLFDAIGIALVTICCAIVAVKCVWNIGLPYAMILASENRGVSIFPLAEFIPLLLAVLIAWVMDWSGWVSARSIAVLGVSVIGFSYMHLFAAPMLVFWIKGKFPNQAGPSATKKDKGDSLN